MTRVVVWSAFAEDDLNKTIDFVLSNWNRKIALKYLDLIENLLEKIAIHPKMYPIINKKLKVRKCVLSKHNSLYYRLNADKIEILRIYDNRQNPSKLKFTE